MGDIELHVEERGDGEPLPLGCTHAGRHAAPQPHETGRASALKADDWAERMRALAPDYRQ